MSRTTDTMTPTTSTENFNMSTKGHVAMRFLAKNKHGWATGRQTARLGRGTASAGIGLVTLLIACSACSSASAGDAAKGTATGRLEFGVVAPFSGTDASFGPGHLAGCLPAVSAIVKAGGILGDKDIRCKDVDTRGDPADAVPIVQQLIASNPDLVGVTGPTSDEALAVVPILNAAKVPMFAATGQTAFNTNTTYKYFWRIQPPDNDVAVAMALYAHSKGYTRAAEVFGTDISSSGAVPTLTKTFTHLGGKIVESQSIPLGQTSYASEVARVVAAHPQVIFTEADAQTSATYLAELAQAGGLAPIIGTNGTAEPTWVDPVSKAVGSQNMVRYFSAATPYMPLTGPAFDEWKAAFNSVKSQEPPPANQWLDNSHAATNYDAINIMALAMEAAKSSRPAVYNSFIPKVTTASPGAVKVYSFAAGKKAILAGKRVQYVGATGAVTFDRYHNSPGGFEIVNSHLGFVSSYTAAQISALLTSSGGK